ncbi:MAG: MFS transporter [bacterium]
MKKSPLFIIFLVVFIDLLGFGMIIPILPYYVKSFGASAVTLSWLMASYSGMQFLFSPFWGNLSDRIGRRPVLQISILGIGASMVVLGFANSLFWLFLGRIIAGFFAANLSVASAYIADVTPPEKRAKGMGMIGAAFGLGFTLGPPIGGYLSKLGHGYGLPAYVVGGLAFLNFVFASLRLKEPDLSVELRKSHRNRPTSELRKQILENPKTGLAILMFFLVTTGFAQLETTFALYLLSRFNLDADHAGYILGYMGIVMILIQGGAIGRLVKAAGEIRLVFFGTGLMAISLLAASFSATQVLFILPLLILAFGYAITNPSLSSLTSRNAPREIQGATMGTYQSAGSLARIIGPLIAGLLYDHWGRQTPFWGASALFFLVCVISLVKKSVWNENSLKGTSSQTPLTPSSPEPSPS